MNTEDMEFDLDNMEDLHSLRLCNIWNNNISFSSPSSGNNYQHFGANMPTVIQVKWRQPQPPLHFDGYNRAFGACLIVGLFQESLRRLLSS